MYLNCHSWFSFHYGTLKPEQLLEEAQRCGIRKIILTDINNTSGVMDFVRLAPLFNVEPAVGIEFRNADQIRFIGIAKNNDGFEELNRFLSVCLKAGSREGESSGNRDAVVPERAPEFNNVWVIYPMEKQSPGKEKENISALSLGNRTIAEKFSDSHHREERKKTVKFKLRENEFIGVRPGSLSTLPFSGYKKYTDRCVILWPVSFRNKTDFNVHRLLCAIGHNTLLSKLHVSATGVAEEIMIPEADIRHRYSIFPQIIRNTEKILEESEIHFVFHESKNKKTFTGNAQEDFDLLKRETFSGLEYRYPTTSGKMMERAEKELRMIGEYGFSSYFLINWDLLKYARHKNYFYVGRGSGANSIVAYALQITDVDPVELDLYFERFLNPYRKNPPDFDIDFSWKDRDDITEYIFGKHGEEHTALLATYSTYQSRAVVRELGKVFGLPKEEIDSIFDIRGKFRAEDHIKILIKKYSARLHDFPHHLSVHAGGILISEKPITAYTALNFPPKGFPLTQFSMIEAEDIGLYKFDILSQRGLGHIRDTVDIVKENRGIEIDIHAIAEFKEDEKIKALIRNGRCMGGFYVESPGMRMLLKKLAVDTYLQLVAASSIIRPGVASSGMMREYILRTHDKSRITYIHPVMKELMEETYGIMVYQEDVIKVAHHFAGLDLSEADVLRRGMSGKFRSREEFQKIKDRFFENCRTTGYEEQVTAEVWRQIESFAGYSFSKGHSASYAVESYQSLYLKAHFPLEFMVGVINNFGGFYNTEFYVHEARMSGAQIHPPDINSSVHLTCIHGKDIYLGFIHMSSFEQKLAHNIVREREKSGAYKSLEEFMDRVSIEIEQLRLLVRIGAFRFTGRTRKQLLWDIHAHLGHERKTEVRNDLFETPTAKFELPELHEHPLEEALNEIEILGFPLITPFALLKDGCQLPASGYQQTKGVILSSGLPFNIGKEIEIIGYLVTIKYTRTVKGDPMAFAYFFDCKGNYFDTTHFPRVNRDYPFRGRGCYRIRGKVDEEFSFCSITVTYMEKLPTIGADDLVDKKTPTSEIAKKKEVVSAQETTSKNQPNLSLNFIGKKGISL